MIIEVGDYEPRKRALYRWNDELYAFIWQLSIAEKSWENLF